MAVGSTGGAWAARACRLAWFPPAEPTATVRIDPLREQAWRLLMRVRAAQGLEDRVIDAYRSCEAALETVGLAPSVSTRLLVDGLRR